MSPWTLSAMAKRLFTEGCGIVCCVAMIFVLVQICAGSLKDRCNRQAFLEVSDQSVTKKSIVREGPLLWTQCRRLCRQYLECLAFTVEWQTEELGACNIYSGVISKDELSPTENVSLFVSCPPNFEWNPNAKMCYTSKVQGPSTREQAVQTCAKLYPGATLVESRSGIQNEHLRPVGGGIIQKFKRKKASVLVLPEDDDSSSDEDGRAQSGNAMSDSRRNDDGLLDDDGYFVCEV